MRDGRVFCTACDKDATEYHCGIATHLQHIRRGRTSCSEASRPGEQLQCRYVWHCNQASTTQDPSSNGWVRWTIGKGRKEGACPKCQVDYDAKKDIKIPPGASQVPPGQNMFWHELCLVRCQMCGGTKCFFGAGHPQGHRLARTGQ